MLKKDEYIARYGKEAWEVEHERRKAKQREAQKRYRIDHPEKDKEYYLEHREERLKYSAEHFQRNKEKKNTQKREWRKNNRRKHLQSTSEYLKTPYGRATHLVSRYKYSDIEKGRDGFSLTPVWVLNHIFSSTCVYCGDSDWKHLGCDRIDNTKPHTPENCVCSCGVCNVERQIKKMSVEEFKDFRKTHPRGWDSIDNLKPDIVEINGKKVLKKKAG